MSIKTSRKVTTGLLPGSERSECWTRCLLPAALFSALCLIGCQKSAPISGTTAAPITTPTAAHLPAQGNTDATTVKVTYPQFDAQRAFDLLKQQVAFGPRYLGTTAHQQTLDFLLAQMRKYADETVLQKLTYRGMTVTNV